MSWPSHHRPDGRFRNPWPEAAGDDALRKRFREVAWEWVTKPQPANPDLADLPLAEPRVGGDTPDGQVRITWAGHASFLLQYAGLHVLTDPMWSERPSPVSWIGSSRFVPAHPAFEALPRIDAVLLSHDHYDHLDRPTVRALHGRFGDELAWYTPLGYRAWLRTLGIRRVVELDWWQDAALPGGDFRAVALPARHWSRRAPWDTNRRLWCSWAVVPERAAAPRVYFAGDSGPCSVFSEIGERIGPFDASVIPIGAYEPRWFMGAAHMSPEESVGVYRQLGGCGLFVPAHWGTFRLTFEPPLEPPKRLRAAWRGAGLPEADLRVLRHGETLELSGEAAG